ncbi:MAG: NAD(P)/FAD-dependent oxidoreductase [Anaeromyxobacteraceae bacterium]
MAVAGTTGSGAASATTPRQPWGQRSNSASRDPLPGAPLTLPSHARAVVLATGGRPRTLGVPGEEALLDGKGISFCATCDAAACAGKDVLVMGSGDAALEEPVFLARFANRVIVSVRRDEGSLRAPPGRARRGARQPAPRVPLAHRGRTLRRRRAARRGRPP